MKYQYLPDCNGFEEEKFPQWYTLEDKDYWQNPWVLKRTSRDVVTRYELKDNVLTHEEQPWYVKADCWKLITEEEALGAVAPIYPTQIRTNLWFDKDDGVVIQADLMPDDRFIQLKFDAEGVYYEGSCETMV
jgi:hypothetical protein